MRSFDEQKTNVSLFRSLRDAIIVVDETRTIIDVNPAFTRIFGYAREQAVGLKTDVLFADPEEYKSLGRQMQAGSAAEHSVYRITYRRQDGATFVGEKSVQLSIDTDGTARGFVGLVRDISARVEDELRIRALLKEKETLLAEVHHRVKNNMIKIPATGATQ